MRHFADDKETGSANGLHQFKLNSRIHCVTLSKLLYLFVHVLSSVKVGNVSTGFISL